MKNFESRPREEGAALITTLVLVTAIALIVIGVFSVSRQEVEITGSALSKTRANLAEQAAFEDAASLLRSITRGDQYFVTVATEGSGPDLTRFHFISQPQTNSLVHVPLFAGGEIDSVSMPDLDSRPTEMLAATPIGRPVIKFGNREAEKRLKLPRLTHLSVDGSTFQENQFPTTGFIDLEPPPPGSAGTRSSGPGLRYTYWIEDLEGLPNLDTVAASTNHHLSADGEPLPDFFRGGYSEFDSRINLSNSGDQGFRLSATTNPTVFYQFPKAFRGQGLINQIAPGLSPRDLAIAPWAIGTTGIESHPFAQVKQLARDPYFRPTGTGDDTAPELNRFSSGLSSYLSRPFIPYGHGYPDEGLPRHNLNRLVANADMEVANIIERNLPNFEERKGGFPLNPVDASAKDYTATIAASLIDYADGDSLPSTPSNTANAGNRQYRGVDAYCPVNEFFVEFEYHGYPPPEDGNYVVIFVAKIYAEFWNTFNRPITMENVAIEYEFLDIPQFTCFSSTWRLDPSTKKENAPRSQPVPSVALAPNEIKVVPFGEIKWEVPIGNTGSLPIAFPIIENFKAQPSAGTVNPRANYQLFIDGDLVDTGGRSPQGSDDAHGFFFYQQSRLNQNDPFMRVGGSVPRIKAHGSGTQLNPGGHGIQGTTLGDPWMNFYTTSTFDNFRFRTSEYRNHASPGSRNFSQQSVPSSRTDCFSDQTRVRDWPDRGYDNPIGIQPSSDSLLPIDTAFILPTDPRHAPWRISNSERYFSVTELGNIHDPVMWVYGSADATRLLPSQNYRDEADRTKLNPYLVSLPANAEKNSRWGGGNTLRIGRPEHELFDQPGMRASQLLDLFHSGVTGTNLTALNDSEVALLYENFDNSHHLAPPTAPGESEAILDPYARLYAPEMHAQSEFEFHRGQLNINTVPTLFEMEALLRGPLVSSDVVVDPTTADDPETPEYTDEGTLGELTKSLDPDSIPLIARGLFEARPFYSPSHLARVLSELIKQQEALPDHHNDAEAEETFARIFNTTSFSSRHFRIHTYGETYEPTTGTILSRDRKVYDVFVKPVRDDAGEIENTVLQVIRVSNP